MERGISGKPVTTKSIALLSQGGNRLRYLGIPVGYLIDRPQFPHVAGVDTTLRPLLLPGAAGAEDHQRAGIQRRRVIAVIVLDVAAS